MRDGTVDSMKNPSTGLSRRHWREVAERLWHQTKQLFTNLTRTRGATFGIVVVSIFIFLSLFGTMITPYDPVKQDYKAVLQSPSITHPMGTDHLGRDVLARVIGGARVSMQAGLVSVGLSVFIGCLVGLIGGFYGGIADDVIMRLSDVMFSFPSLVLALAVTSALGPGLRNAMIAIAVVFVPIFSRLARAETLKVKECDYVLAAQSMGTDSWRIVRRHILPNIAYSIIVQASLLVGVAIIVEASLSFLGLGVPPPTPSWGSDLRLGAKYLERGPWMSIFPGLCIYLTVLAINLIGDGLRLALDPRMKGVREALAQRGKEH
jgi:peptide/nickel transport system permease protein